MQRYYKALKMIEGRQLVFFVNETNHTLNGIRTFLSGYELALHNNEIAWDGPEMIVFHDWVARKLKFGESTAGWANMILAVTIGLDPKTTNWMVFDANYSAITPEQHLESIERFYELLEEYMSWSETHLCPTCYRKYKTIEGLIRHREEKHGAIKDN